MCSVTSVMHRLTAMKPRRKNFFWSLLLLLTISTARAVHVYGQAPLDDTTSPRFEDTPTDIQALVGQTVILPCNVADLGDKVVSWIRTRDLHILTSDLHTFTSDDRFGVLHTPASRAWNLRIMGAQPGDEGKYECQVNTDPKLNRPVFLTVRGNDWPDDRAFGPIDPGPAERLRPGSASSAVVSRARILGPAEQFVALGSTVTFTCFVTGPYPRGHPPDSVLWLHAGRVVSIQGERGGVSLSTVSTEAQTTSRLTLAQLRPSDAGRYTCAPASGVAPASVALVLTDGERTEAMQRDGSFSRGAVSLHCHPLLLLLLFLFLDPLRLLSA